MKKFQAVAVVIFVLAMLFVCSAVAWCSEGGDALNSVVNVQKYNRAIHIMAMLLVGFGFLMVFVKKYGRSAVTATYLLVSVSIPLYILADSLGWFGEPATDIDRLILAEFAAASLLICAGAPLGRLKMGQYILLGILFIPCYMLNEWIAFDNGFGLIASGAFRDTGGVDSYSCLWRHIRVGCDHDHDYWNGDGAGDRVR